MRQAVILVHYEWFKDCLIKTHLQTLKMSELKTLIIEQTHKTPRIELNHSTGELVFTGKSIPENAVNTFQPALNWTREYVLNAKPITNLRLNMEYFNTSTSMWISKMISALTKISNPDYLLLVHLYIPLEEYDDMKSSADIKDTFSPITSILQNSKICVGLKLYATNEKSEVVRDALVLM
jgi:SiaC family regulatory phosphoprotein